MKLQTICILIILFLSKKYSGFAQSKNEILQYQHVFDDQKQQGNDSFATKKINNDVDAIISGLYLIYKQFISSQDMSSCVFYPSCSTYALLSLQQKGLFIGSLATFDRLCRCNPFNKKNYPIYQQTHLLYDPVE